VLRYEVHVHSISDTAIDGRAPEHKDEDVRLVAEHTVVSIGHDGALVRVRVGEQGAPPASFLVRFDDGGQVHAVQAEDGGGVSPLGLAEIFPAAAASPPTHGLSPGKRWKIDEPVRLPGADADARLRGTGRLTRLVSRDGDDLAYVSTTASLPLRTSTTATEGSVALRGTQRLRQQAVYDLGDGAVREATSTTVGRFDLTLLPPSGDHALAVRGTSRVHVVSTTRRLN
jgi:hypothetical protein